MSIKGILTAIQLYTSIYFLTLIIAYVFYFRLININSKITFEQKLKERFPFYNQATFTLNAESLDTNSLTAVISSAV